MLCRSWFDVHTSVHGKLGYGGRAKMLISTEPSHGRSTLKRWKCSQERRCRLSRNSIPQHQHHLNRSRPMVGQGGYVALPPLCCFGHSYFCGSGSLARANPLILLAHEDFVLILILLLIVVNVFCFCDLTPLWESFRLCKHYRLVTRLQ